jgi:four helix bundle protein
MSVSSYKDLLVWQKSMDLVVAVYEQAKSFPKDEIYSLTQQIKRSAVSIPSNLAEGSSKKSTKEFLRFINIAYGSLAELETQLLLANKLQMLDNKNLENLNLKTTEIAKMCSGLINSLNSKLSQLNSYN